MTAIESLDALRKNLEIAKQQLKNVDDNIKKFTGRDPTDDKYLHRVIDGGVRRTGARPPLKSVTSRPFIPPHDGQPVADDDLHVSLASSVVCVDESRTRLEAAKNMRKSDRDRGRRLLGILQGTLNQFKAESLAANSLPQMTKRRQVDAKLEARAEEERATARKERAQLFRSRREQQLEISMLQQKMKAAKEFVLWKVEMEKMKRFCRTEVVPHIFFCPKLHNSESRLRMKETADAINELIARKENKLRMDLEQAVANKRRLATSHNEPEQSDAHSEVADDESSKLPGGWSSPSPSHQPVTHSGTVPVVRASQLKATSFLAKSQQLRLQSATASDAGELSDASETFAMEGDEPVLMEEENVSAPSHSAASPDKDNRTVIGTPLDQNSVQSSNDDTRTVRFLSGE